MNLYIVYFDKNRNIIKLYNFQFLFNKISIPYFLYFVILIFVHFYIKIVKTYIFFLDLFNNLPHKSINNFSIILYLNLNLKMNQYLC